MANLTNRYIVVPDNNGGEEVVKCIGQSPAGHWIKVLGTDGFEQMLPSEAFIRVADAPSGGPRS